MNHQSRVDGTQMSYMPNTDRMFRDLETLVSLNSENPPGWERDVALWIVQVLTEIGLETRMNEFQTNRFNVEGVYRNGHGPSFAFNTHMDTVPASDGWSTDPFSLVERDGKLFGRGTCDCKGPLASMIEAVRALVENKHLWSGTLLVVFTGDEEIASAGAKHYVKNGPKIDAVVVGEPTGNACYSAHKGSFRPIVRVFGKAAHSGSPHLGENAIFRMAELFFYIKEFHEAELARRHHWLVGSPSLTVTRIQGGHADNVIPSECEILLDRRLIPGETDDSATEEIKSILEKAALSTGLRAEISGFHETTGGATETSELSEIVKVSIEACRAAGVMEPGPFGFQGACDLVHFIKSGAQGVVVGPGNIAVAHRPDEFVPKNEFINSARIYSDIAHRFLKKA
jgi:acetylornithine deacetylase/succinyl-diaminopimelate desuccinylase family protein